MVNIYLNNHTAYRAYICLILLRCQELGVRAQYEKDISNTAMSATTLDPGQQNLFFLIIQIKHKQLLCTQEKTHLNNKQFVIVDDVKSQRLSTIELLTHTGYRIRVTITSRNSGKSHEWTVMLSLAHGNNPRSTTNIWLTNGWFLTEILVT